MQLELRFDLTDRLSPFLSFFGKVVHDIVKVSYKDFSRDVPDCTVVTCFAYVM